MLDPHANETVSSPHDLTCFSLVLLINQLAVWDGTVLPICIRRCPACSPLNMLGTRTTENYN